MFVMVGGTNLVNNHKYGSPGSISLFELNIVLKTLEKLIILNQPGVEM